MGKDCCHIPQAAPDRRYARILLVALVINAIMFAVEITSSFLSHSVALLADSIDFLGDSANYAISLYVLGSSLKTRARASMVKALCMAVFGIWALATIIYQLYAGNIPHAPTMGIVGALALLANVFVAALLFKYRTGDSNMVSVWLCTRNDAIGNLLVLMAAFGVMLTGSYWPDLLTAFIMSSLALSSAIKVFKQARAEIGHEGH